MSAIQIKPAKPNSPLPNPIKPEPGRPAVTYDQTIFQTDVIREIYINALARAAGINRQD